MSTIHNASLFICQAILPESVRNPPQQQQQQQTRPFTGSKTAGQGVLFTDSLNPEALNSLESAYSRFQVSFHTFAWLAIGFVHGVMPWSEGIVLLISNAVEIALIVYQTKVMMSL